MEDECRKAQDDEKLVILSIYEKEAQFEKFAWKIWKPLSVIIHLEPTDSATRGGSPAISVNLNVVCSAKYPYEPPSVSLVNPKGISNERVAVLQNQLVEKCKTLVGNPMILELCSDVRDFLYENSGTVKGSFHDNMVRNLEEQKQEIQRKRVDSEIRDVEQVAQIVKEREEYHLEGKKDEEDKPKSFLEDAPIRVIAGKTIAVKSSTFTKRQRPHGFCNEWVGVFQNEEVLVSEWVFKFSLGRQGKKKEPNFKEFLKKLDETEASIRRLPTLSELDQTVVPYLFCHVDRRSILSQNMNVQITVGQKVKESEQSLPFIINSVKHEPNICRRLAGHAVCALRWLHEMGIAHGAISSNCFWFSDNSFRVSDAGTLSLLLSLADVFQKCVSGMAVSMTGEEKHHRKKDLFALGTMIDGIRLDQASSNSPAGQDDDLTKFITTCQSAKSVEELLNMPYLKVDLDAGGSGNSRFGTWHIPENSRLTDDFILMKGLGTGGFGDVLLARNKVDDGNYAIKRIPLYDQSEKWNRRITREAKLFAKLNHPNVVRYYSAWIENTAEKAESEISKRSPGSFLEKSCNQTEDSLLPTRLRNLEKLNVPLATGDTSEWSSSYRGNGTRNSDDSLSDEDSKHVETLFDRGDSDNEDFICFENSAQGFSQETEETNTEKSYEKKKDDNELADTPLVVTTESAGPRRILYIQMEFCGHGTLRSMIDNHGLFGNHKTIWRMFREVLSGLSYIHQRNMIHRDIKPMNILLDEEDRIKIGDFGLATRDFFRKMDSQNAPLEVNSKVSGQTKDIGTELYMAPELFDLEDPAPYSSKIDVYSTGVVLFEMFYKPLHHGMERLSTLKALKKSITFPNDFGQGYQQNQQNLARKIITMMLQEKAENRPTVSELLENERIAVDVDDQMLQTFLQKSLKRGSQAHRNCLNTLFGEEISGSQNYCFDVNSCQDKIPNKNLHLEEIKDQLKAILSTHCFEPMYTHQLLASTTVQAVMEVRQKPVYLLDSQGFPVALPLDLRQNFVRFCCRNDIYRKKRYCIDRVFRSTDGIGFEHPTERWECSVDSVGPVSSSITLTSEMLGTAAEICAVTLPQVNFTLKIGNIGFVLAVCRHLNMADEQSKQVLEKLHELSTSNKIFSLPEKTEFLAGVVGSKISQSLLQFLVHEDSLGAFKEGCKPLVRSRDESVKNLARKALSEIESVNQILEALGVPTKQMRIKFDASLVYRPATFHDGLVFMIVSETTTKKGINRAIILGGGRYDSSLVRERHPKDSQPKVPLCLIGCSISLDMMVGLRKFYKEKCSSPCSAIVCSLEERTIEKFMLARMLWNKDVATDIMHEPVSQLADLLAHCETTGIKHILVVFGKNEVLVHSGGIDHGKKNFDEAIELCSRPLEPDDDSEIVTVATNTPLKTFSTFSHANFSNCDVKIAIPDNINYANKKRIMNFVRNSPPEAVFLFSNKEKIEILVTELPKELVKSIAGTISRSTSIKDLSTYFEGLGRQFGKSKEDLECLFVCLKQLLSPRLGTVPIIILFRHSDSFYKVII